MVESLVPSNQIALSVGIEVGYQEDVKRPLLERDRVIIEKITGLAPPSFLFELSSGFYYLIDALKEMWSGKAVEKEIVE